MKIRWELAAADGKAAHRSTAPAAGKVMPSAEASAAKPKAAPLGPELPSVVALPQPSLTVLEKRSSDWIPATPPADTRIFRENSEVFPAASVAVAVRYWPAVTPLIVTANEPLLFVVPAPTKVLP